MLSASALLLTASIASGQAAGADDPKFPGLPDEGGAYVWPYATSINKVTAARQWVRPPVVQTYAIPKVVGGYPLDRRCIRNPPFESTQDWEPKIYLPLRSTDQPRDRALGPFTVRTVAFGSIPVQAEVLLSQAHAGDGYAEPFRLTYTTGTYCPGHEPAPLLPYFNPADPRPSASTARDIRLTGKVLVTVRSLVVDGVPMRLAETCRTKDYAHLALGAPDYYLTSNYPQAALTFDQDFRLLAGDQKPSRENVMTTPVFNPAEGGLLTGTIAVPPFEGCTTGDGDDLSRLLTATVSGPDNPVTMRAHGFENPRPDQKLPPLPFPATTLP